MRFDKRQAKGETTPLWVNKRSDWFQAWTYIRTNAESNEGKVNLTQVRKELPVRAFTDKSWRYFINRLKSGGLIKDVEVSRLGQGNGSKMTATVQTKE